MKKYQPLFITCILATLALAWLFKSSIRNAFAPGLTFANNHLQIVDSNATTTISAYKGNVLIVACFQTWCIDCARETPSLNKLASALNFEKFKVIYVSDEVIDKIKGFKNRFEANNILFTQSAKSLASLGISVYPTTYLINKKGVVVTTKLEGYNWENEEALIKKLIAE